jgi:hypothetical protein
LTKLLHWFKFKVTPGSKVVITLTNLVANYDLTLYKDIGQAFTTLNSPQDLTRLSAEFAPDSFAPDSFAPDSFAADAFSPDSFAPDSFAPDSFAPDSFAQIFCTGFVRTGFVRPRLLRPGLLRTRLRTRVVRQRQTRSLIAVSARHCWRGHPRQHLGNTGGLYRVAGMEVNLQTPFHLDVQQLTVSRPGQSSVATIS